MDGWFEVEPGIRLHYVVDDFSDPWRRADTVLMVHGGAESAGAWRPIRASPRRTECVGR